MPYEPTLIIKRSDLQQHENKFENWYDEKDGSDKQKIYKFLDEAYKRDNPPKIDGIELLLCTPELTSFNAAVRITLFEWGVQFAISY